MPADLFTRIDLGTAVLIIFALCAGFVLLRGVLRMAVGTLIIGGSLALAWFVWRDAPLWLFGATGRAPAWAAPALAAATFLLAWWVFSRIVRFVFHPGDGGRPSSFAGFLGRLVFSLLPTSLLGIAAAAVFQHDTPRPAGQAAGTAPTLLASLTAWLDAAIPREWLGKLDPLANQARVELAEKITRQAASPRAAVIDPQTGKPIPRAVIVEDPELQNLAREGKFNTLLRHPSLTKALADPRIRNLLR